MRNSVLGGLAVLVLLATPGLAMAEDLKFTLTNNSARAVKNFYTSPTTTTDWQEDVLGEDTIAPGQSDEITIADGSTQCVYDMRFVMEDGAELVDKDIDLCKLGEYTLSDSK
ncbi:MAG: hypothetical protein P4M09_21510 [Devosia sp.]|nr:hypothetical protein [Devosia sp.]